MDLLRGGYCHGVAPPHVHALPFQVPRKGRVWWRVKQKEKEALCQVAAQPYLVEWHHTAIPIINSVPRKKVTPCRLGPKGGLLLGHARPPPLQPCQHHGAFKPLKHRQIFAHTHDCIFVIVVCQLPQEVAWHWHRAATAGAIIGPGAMVAAAAAMAIAWLPVVVVHDHAVPASGPLCGR